MLKNKNDGSYWICGEGIGTKQKTVSGEADYTVTCSSEFVPWKLHINEDFISQKWYYICRRKRGKPLLSFKLNDSQQITLNDAFIKRLSRMEMEGDRKELLKSMCNLSQGIKEQGIEQGRREERISTLVTFFKNDGTVAAAKQMLNSSDEDIKIAKERLSMIEE